MLDRRRLNRATFARQMLLERRPRPVPEVIRHLVGLQSQEPASPYLALWNRISGFDPAELDAALTDRRVVKATLLRITLHAVDVDDHPVWRCAMRSTLRSARYGDRRFAATGMGIGVADRLADALVARLTEPAGNADVQRLLGELMGADPHEGVWWALRGTAPVVHAPGDDEPWMFGARPRYVAPPTPDAVPDEQACLQELVRRYLGAFGPATRQDIAQFCLLRQSVLGPAIEAMADELVRYADPEGRELLDVPDAPLPAADVRVPPRLLGMWDSVLLAYRDRSRVIPPDLRPHVIRRNGDVLPTVLVDGYVAGVWRPADGGIEVTTFSALDGSTWDALAAEARDLVAFLAERDPAVYRRYARWWTRLPSGRTRVLPG